MKALITGNMAAALGAKLCRPEVLSAYPITPQTTIIEYLAKMVADDELKAEYIKVESEHSAMAACIGAAAAGSRVFTATSSQGLLLMHEMLFQASGLRLPIVMVNVNRAVGAPWNTATDQTDSLAQRDTGWGQFYCENCQEVLDTVIQAYRIAEIVSLPIMVVSEGFILSHTSEPVEIPEQEKVDFFLPSYKPVWQLDNDHPAAYGAHAYPMHYSQLRRDMQRAMMEVASVQVDVADEFYKIFGRRYAAVEYIGPQSPEILLITSGTTSGTAKMVLKNHPEVALMKIRMFRPFPADLIRNLARCANKIAIIDRNISFGSRGIFAEAVRSSLYYITNRPSIFEFILGIGGIDITPDTISKVIEYTTKACSAPEDPIWQEDLK